MMDVFDQIKKLLEERKISFQVFEHEKVFTSLEAVKVRKDATLSQGAKALVMIADKKPIMVVLPGDRKVDTKNFKVVFGVTDLRMASREEVKEITGLEVGCIPPMGNLFQLTTYLDTSLGKNDMIFFNPGRHDRSISLKFHDLVKFVSPIMGEFSTANEKED